MFRFILYYTLCAAMSLLAIWGLWTLYRVVYAYIQYVKILKSIEAVRVVRIPAYHYKPSTWTKKDIDNWYDTVFNQGKTS